MRLGYPPCLTLLDACDQRLPCPRNTLDIDRLQHHGYMFGERDKPSCTNAGHTGEILATSGWDFRETCDLLCSSAVLIQLTYHPGFSYVGRYSFSEGLLALKRIP